MNVNVILLALAYGLQGDEHVESSNYLGALDESVGQCEPETVAAERTRDAYEDGGAAGALLPYIEAMNAESALLEQKGETKPEGKQVEDKVKLFNTGKVKGDGSVAGQNLLAEAMKKQYEQGQVVSAHCTPNPSRKKYLPPAGEAPILLVTLGPTGSGKSGLMKKAAEELGKTIDDFRVFLVDDYIENDSKYKETVDKIIKENGLAVMHGDEIGSTLTDEGRRKLTSPDDQLLKSFTNAYFDVRGKTGCARSGGCGMQFDCDLEEAMKAKENIIFETTGEKLTTINWLISNIGWTPEMNAKKLGYKVVVAATMVNFCTLVERNSLRAVNSLEHYLKDRKKNPALRLPNVLDNPSQSRFRNIVSAIRDNVYDLHRGCNKDSSHPCPLKDWDVATDKILVFHNNAAALKGPLQRLSMVDDFSIPSACVRFCQEPVASPGDRVSVTFEIAVAYEAKRASGSPLPARPSDAEGGELGTTVDLGDGKPLQFYNPTPVTLPAAVRPSLKIPMDSTHFAYVLPCRKEANSSSHNCEFREGGFVYFKNGKWQRVNRLEAAQRSEEGSRSGVLALAPLVPLTELVGRAKEFSAHFAAGNGAPVGPSRSELKKFGYKESLWVGPDITDEMPHGGFLHACYDRKGCECKASPEVEVGRYKDYLKKHMSAANVERIGHGLIPTIESAALGKVMARAVTKGKASSGA
jgi:hypothetical protein